MTATLIAMAVAVIGASLLQAATGIGYGVIAGPILLIVLDGTEAFQISILHNLLIALILAPRLIRRSDRNILKILLLSGLLGLPVGFAVLAVAGVTTMKVLAAIMVAATLAFSFVGLDRRGEGAELRSLARSPQASAVGVVSGIMGGALAMPGPVAAAWMSMRGWNKETIRSTILAYFLYAYGFALAMQVAFAEFTTQTWLTGLQLSPLVIAGIVAGGFLSNAISEAIFRLVLRLVLAGTIIALIVSLNI